jgi:class 3 adenylate cyclase
MISAEGTVSVDRLRDLWSTLIRTGIGARTATGTRQLLFLNTIVLLVLVLIVQNLLAASVYYPTTVLLIAILIGHFVCIALTLVWNHQRRYRLGRVWFVLSAVLFLTLYSVAMGRESYWELFLGALGFLLFYMFPAEDRAWMVSLLALSCLCFLGVHFLVPAQGLLSGLPAAYVYLVGVFNVVGFLFCVVAMGAAGYIAVNRTERRLSFEHERSEQLLHNILPPSIANRLKEGEQTIADGHESVTVMFFDLVKFTPLSAQHAPADVVGLLTDIFSHLDDLVEQHHAEKIETVGDGYMAVAGLSGSIDSHAHIVAGLALDIKHYFASGVWLNGHRVDFRIGINTGPLTAGVIGRKKMSYKIWGDTVNTASRMQSHSIPGEIQISEATYRLLADSFVCEARGAIEVKGKGVLETYLLTGRVYQGPVSS